TFDPVTLGELSEAIDAALAAGVVGIGLTGVDRVFCAGADLSVLASVATRTEALEAAQLGHRVLGRLGELPVPTFAFINGVALGGGLEAALHCTYRTVTAKTRQLGLPELTLGLIPGWGGTWLLANLAGIDAALQVIVDAALSGGRTFTGGQLASFDPRCELLESDDFLNASLAWAARVLSGDVVVVPAAVDRDEEHWQAAVVACRARVDARLHGATPAPYRALQLLSEARTSTRADGFRAEDDAFADLLMTDDSRAALYAFTLTRSRAKRPAGAPDVALARQVRTVGLIGAGLMASQIALLICRQLRVPVILSDLDQHQVDKGLAWIRDQVAALEGNGQLSADDAASVTRSITGSIDKADLGNADLVIEAVFEDLDVKIAVLAEVEPWLRADCVLATNTSSLSLATMGAVLANPSRFVGMHFFNPVARMPLLEIIRAANTDVASLATAFAVGKQLGKSCVLVQDAPGFVVNRLLTRMYVELMKTIDEGTPMVLADGALRPLGLPMSPLELLALIGPPVMLHVNETLAAAWPDRFPVSPNLEAIVASGMRSVLEKDDPTQLAPGVQILLDQGDRPSTAGEVLTRIRDGLADEAWRMLDEGVVGEAEDLDTCMLLGAGWPTHLGGITPWLDRSRDDAGGSRRFLAPGVASVPR
ncbi:MAG TPA: 3-hydroxyacyl-CoA dehydrogenase NAD-binding domain-containing protein, partial [Acidothermaceae bacterium]|nr:3-hydroxyacyl-CoA dehydrogenase NAD-binding domain-containing protein [Acidothermaceae bacterium]